ncbi:MAG: hypothetical protein KBD76_13555, partial [Bacteriovorax sp.]|nr:hypothetical protein [Bacteriovorax sp.]
MFTLETSHLISLVIASIFSLFLHFSLSGFFKKLDSYFIFFVLFPFILMVFTLFIPQDFLQYGSYALILTGCFLGLRNIPLHSKTIQTKWNTLERKEKWIIAFLAIYLFSFFMNTTIFKDGGSIQDAMVYHLEGPKEWALYLNGAKFNTNNPITFTTSYYDYFYYFIFLILKPLFIHLAALPSTGYEFLSYTTLLNAQIFTGIIALIYVPLLILRFCADLGKYKYLAVVFIYSLRIITWSWFLPKNDIFPFFCFLVGIELFRKNYVHVDKNDENFPLFLSALIVGIGTASKLTNAYILIFSLLFLCSFYFQKVNVFIKGIGLIKAISIVATGLFIGASIFLIRNIIHTGNPFFPIDKFGFPNIYISAYAHRPEFYYFPVKWAMALQKIKLHIVDQPQLLFILISAFMFKIRSLPIFYILMVTYMSKQNGKLFTFRMTTIYLVLALILYILTVQRINSLPHSKFKKYYNYCFITILLLFSHFQPEKIIKYPL